MIKEWKFAEKLEPEDGGKSQSKGMALTFQCRLVLRIRT